MPSELSVHAVQQGPMEFAISDGEHEVTIDYPLPGGRDGDLKGMTPLRLLLASLAGCSGSSVAALLRRDGAAGRARRGHGARAAARRAPHGDHRHRPRVHRGHGDVDPARVRARADAVRDARSARCGRCSRRVRPVSSSFTVVTGVRRDAMRSSTRLVVLAAAAARARGPAGRERRLRRRLPEREPVSASGRRSLTSKVSGKAPVKLNLGTHQLGTKVRLAWKLSGPDQPPVILTFRLINADYGTGFGYSMTPERRRGSSCRPRTR